MTSNENRQPCPICRTADGVAYGNDVCDSCGRLVPPFERPRQWPPLTLETKIVEVPVVVEGTDN
jgi:hypothetical protein